MLNNNINPLSNIYFFGSVKIKSSKIFKDFILDNKNFDLTEIDEFIKINKNGKIYFSFKDNKSNLFSFIILGYLYIKLGKYRKNLKLIPESKTFDSEVYKKLESFIVSIY
jgi:hypothetical protein